MKRIVMGLLCSAVFAACSHAAATQTAVDATGAPASGGGACGQVANEMAGIEGWAPGAGHALEMGRTNGQSFGAFGGALAGGGTAAPSTAAPPLPPCTPPPLDPNDPLAKLPAPSDKLWSSIDTAESALPKERFDVAAAAAALGANVPATYAFVRDHFALDAYPGVMRGAQGTLIAGAGNPDDQAVLLAALLKANGFSVRFARSTLSPADLSALAQRVETYVPQPFPTADPSAKMTVLGLNFSDVSNKLTAIAAHTTGRIKQQIASGSAFADAMSARLAKSGITVGEPAAAQQARWAQELRTHYYVRVQQNGAWTDLDPSSGGDMGHHVGTPDAAFSSDSIPSDRYTIARVRLFTDSLNGSALNATPVLDKTFNVADAAAKPLYVTVVPASNTPTRSIVADTSMQPTLTLDGDTTNGTPFTMVQSGVQVARVRLEFDVTVPGRPQMTYTRVVYDRLDPATENTPAGAWSDPARSAHLLPFDAAVMIAPGELTQPFLTWASLETMKSLKSAANGNARIAFPVDVLRFFERDKNARHALAAGMGQPARFMHDRVDLAMDLVTSSSRDAKIGWNTRFDIIENGMTALGPDARKAASANLARGMVDEDLETAIAGNGAVTTTSVMGSVDANRGDLAILSTNDSAALRSMQVPPVSSQALTATLAAGHVAVAAQSAKDGNFPWWDVDPASGYAVARMNDGSGDAMVEYVEETEEADPFFKICGEDLSHCVKWANHFKHFMNCGATHPGQGAACVADAACNIGMGELAGALADGAWEDLPGKGWGEVGLDMGLGSIGFGPGENACGAAFGTGESEGGGE